MKGNGGKKNVFEEFYTGTIRETERAVRTNVREGLTGEEAKRRLAEHGENVLAERRRKTAVSRFFAQFNDFLIILLLIAAGVSYFTSLMEGNGDIWEPVIILAIVVLNAVLGTVQESRAQRSLDALKRMSSPHSRVVRDGKEISIDSRGLCVGDIVRFSAGDVISADCRLVSSNGLLVDESALTGESHPIEKDSEAVYSRPTAVGDRRNMVFSSTSVLGGKGTGIVVKTGMDTEVGEIAAMLSEENDTETPLKAKLAEAGKTLGIAALSVCFAVFIIGLFLKLDPLDMFMTAVSLAVAAIPEGLPAIVTIMLAIGVMKLSRQNAIVRSLPSVETLGGADVICSDKTGTLTQNKMKVTSVYSKDRLLTLRLAALCCNETPDPTDAAVLAKAESERVDLNALEEKYRRAGEIPFSSQRKRLTVLRRSAAGGRVIVKGALEYILPSCTEAATASGTTALSRAERKKILDENEKMTSNALRVIAVAYRDGEALKEERLVFAGLLGIEDPPRPEAEEAVRVCKRAGIIPVMITGDHTGTAASVARRVGMLGGEKLMTGAELDKTSDEELAEKIREYRVFSRVTPSHKVRIVKAWQANGCTVAMTGDGVNDAPALSAADIGCSMGRSGTEVAKNASDMILTDDNFATIVSAVRVGRGIFENIQKAVKFLVSSNIGEILTVFGGILLSGAPPLSAIQLLWVNLVTDSLPAIALGMDPTDDSVMDGPSKTKKLFSKGLWRAVAAEGLMIGALALLAFSIGKNVFGNVRTGGTMAFAVLSLSQLVHAFNMRSEGSAIKAGLFKNKYLVLSFFAGLVLEAGVISFPPAAAVFGVGALSAAQWAVTAALSLAPLVIVEAQKALTNKQ
ncbi:MAG TPA: cation-translocating P-type ATPase [Candidatus Ornithomonoglobus intestinigallinarum]|uniref:P-type Ca(2+) transporter n=1 Tax=Candidatus Ornithomonoglobus intestinigallinarum TaxID=2840894 RepID=A0A9D1KQB2_9FIRM|nr:cation-translocating P-type ATPase [Candidatus Ornithomonoglobus intestinigallinarum]